MSIKPCPDPAHITVFPNISLPESQPLPQQSNSFRSNPTASSATSLPSISTCFLSNFASKHFNLTCFRSNFAPEHLNQLPSISIASEQLCFPTTSLSSTAASAATWLQGESATFPNDYNNIGSDQWFNNSLPGETLTILSACRNISFDDDDDEKNDKIIASERQQHWFRSMIL